ncbi:hypothetical protein POTOM_005786 [Populus tomentosa]|uniref:Uncharacterized protein n=1 Tax=Populus tomentosa TaxID=118781 RepID=A0A8X8DEP5_POPTO|nr:hypothetical protein POTOM_005786 [Populus tomentosa]
MERENTMHKTLVSHSVAYELDVEVDNKVVPFKLLEDVNRWEFVDLPIFRVEDPVRPSDENGLMEPKKNGNGLPVLAPFHLAEPIEIWVQDAKDMRISLPHDVDAGVLKKVILADGAVVPVKGARSVCLRHPIHDLPLPLNRTRSGLPSGLLTLAEQLRQAVRSEGAPLLSPRIAGPTSFTSPSSSPSSNNRLKLKRLAPGLVELSLPAKSQPVDALSTVDLEQATTVLTPKHFTTMWPFASVNGSNSNLVGFEKLLTSMLGPKANKKGSFKLLRADVSAQTFVKTGFGVEKKLKEVDGLGLAAIPK